jgi:hypothetical protein
VGESGGDAGEALATEVIGLTYLNLDEDDAESPSRLLWLLLWALAFLLLLPDWNILFNLENREDWPSEPLLL